MYRRFSIFVVLAMMVYACGPTKFRGSSGKRGNSVPPKPPVDLSEGQPEGGPQPGRGVDPRTGKVPPRGPLLTNEVFSHDCSGGAQVQAGYSRTVGDRISAVVEGQICPQSFDNFSLIFIVDYSASMGKHYDTDTNSESPGHDPVRNGTCNRLIAAQTVLNNITQTSVSFNVGMVPFANEAIEKLVIEPVGVDEFRRKYLDRKRFCRYVAQDDAHKKLGESLNFLDLGFSNGSIDPSTNYEAAFVRTGLALQKYNTSNASVWFLTDGEPTAPGNREEALRRGAEAGAALRANPNIKNLVVNGVYFGIRNSPTYQQAAGVLEQATGSSRRVVAVENTNELANVLATIPKPRINIRKENYENMAFLDVSPYGEKAIGIQSLEETSENIWTYRTQPFLLLGEVGRSVPNRVRIEIPGENDFLFKTTYVIDYTQTQ